MSSKLNDIKVLHLAAGNTNPTIAVSTDITAAAVDMLTCDNNCFAIQVVGTVAGTELTFVGKVQESPSTTAASFTDVAGAVFTTITSTTGVGGIQVLNFQRTQRFVRYVGDIAGTTSAVALSVLIGGQKKQY